MTRALRRTLLAVVAAVPLTAIAQEGPGPMHGGPGAAAGGGSEVAEQRMRLVRTLGLAEALGLDEQQALALRQRTAKLDDRRVSALNRMRDAHAVLRRAASGEKVSAGEVDKAIAADLDARTELAAVDRDLVTAVTKGLAPEKRARAALFLARFDSRFGGGGFGPGGAGRGGDRRMGGGGMGLRGAGVRGAAGCPNPECPMRGDAM